MTIRRSTRAAGVLLALSPLLFASACGGRPSLPPDPEPPATTLTEPLRALGSASDGGAAQLAETAFTVVDPSHNGGVDVAWAGEVANTSATDLLVYVNLELTWTDGDGSTHVEPWEGFFDVLPGATAVKGRVMTLDFVPTALDVTIADQRWRPVADLTARSITVGAEVTSSRVEKGADEVGVEAEVVSSYSADSGNAQLLLVFRDAGGKLLGAAEAEDVTGLTAGAHTVDGDIPLRWWPDKADAAESGAALVRVCCNWMDGI
ncbi:hypothetical protein AB0I28_29805 [Phytomonospora sp. NPDC050363]|uniref:hypothetical protein n=1 Tax=Phytomonospora sp. NPDC050363 TaxID=3155642 RepID=UPI0033C98D80